MSVMDVFFPLTLKKSCYGSKIAQTFQNWPFHEKTMGLPIMSCLDLLFQQMYKNGVCGIKKYLSY